MRSSPEPGEGEAGEDPWADKTAEISFSNKEPVVGSGAGDSSDEEENEPAPVKMEVDQEADRKYFTVFIMYYTILTLILSCHKTLYFTVIRSLGHGGRTRELCGDGDQQSVADRTHPVHYGGDRLGGLHSLS